MFRVFFASKLAYKVFIDCHHLFLCTQVTHYTIQSVRACNDMARKCLISTALQSLVVNTSLVTFSVLLEFKQMISCIFGKSWQSGEVPGDWKKGNVTSSFKKGRRKDPGNYRPTRLTSVP